MAELVGDHFDVCVLRDADEATVRSTLRARADYFSSDDGALVMMWSGHGRPGATATGLRLLAHDSPNTPSGGLDAVEVAIEGTRGHRRQPDLDDHRYVLRGQRI